MNNKRLEVFEIKIAELLKENEFTPKRRCDSVSDYSLSIYVIKKVQKTDILVLDFEGIKRIRLGVAHDLVQGLEILRRSGIIRHYNINNAPYVLNFLEIEKEKDVLVYERKVKK